MTTYFKKSLAATMALVLAASVAQAQDSATPAPAAPDAAAPAAPAAPQTAAPDAATPANGPGAPYIAKTIDDWSLQCFKAQDGGKDPCQMYQLMKDGTGNAIADISMVALPAGGKAAAGATIMTPLETLLTANLQLSIDGAQPKVYPFTFCAPPGCFARIGLTADELATFKKGKQVTVTIVPVSTPNKPVSVTMSLKGFTSAFDEVTKNNADLKLK